MQTDARMTRRPTCNLALKLGAIILLLQCSGQLAEVARASRLSADFLVPLDQTTSDNLAAWLAKPGQPRRLPDLSQRPWHRVQRSVRIRPESADQVEYLNQLPVSREPQVGAAR